MEVIQVRFLSGANHKNSGDNSELNAPAWNFSYLKKKERDGALSCGG